MNGATKAVCILAAIGSILSVIAFDILNKRVISGGGPGNDVFAVLLCAIVALPYVLLWFAAGKTQSVTGRTGIFAVTGTCVAIGAFIYSGSFAPTDGEFALVFVAVPAVQAILVIIALLISLTIRRLKRNRVIGDGLR